MRKKEKDERKNKIKVPHLLGSFDQENNSVEEVGFVVDKSFFITCVVWEEK